MSQPDFPRTISSIEDVQSHLPPRNGKPVMLKRVKRVIYTDSTSDYRCTECGFAHPGVTGVTNHLSRQHSTKPRAPWGSKKKATPTTPGIADRIDGIVAQLDALRDEIKTTADDSKVDHTWKDRALKAERRLSTLRRALGGESK